jgi:hypothetical protein
MIPTANPRAGYCKATARWQRMQATQSIFARSLLGTGCFAVVLTVICGLAVSARGQEGPIPPAGDGVPDQLAHYTLKNYTDWVNRYRDAKPEFKPGDTLTQKDIAKLRPFVPPGFFEMLNFPELRMEIAPPEDLSPDQAYMNCTEKYAAQTKLDAEGVLVNYVCGQPFPLSEIRDGDPTSGIKEAWNYNWRPRTWGVRNLNAWVLVRPGGSHDCLGSHAATRQLVRRPCRPDRLRPAGNWTLLRRRRERRTHYRGYFSAFSI